MPASRQPFQRAQNLILGASAGCHQKDPQKPEPGADSTAARPFPNRTAASMNTVTRLKTLIDQQFGIQPEAIDGDAPFASYKIDSLTLAELLFAIEDEFKITVPDELATTVHTLNQLAAALDAVVSGAQLPVFEAPADTGASSATDVPAIATAAPVADAPPVLGSAAPTQA
jgi:acyl carrier protein